MKTYFEIHGHHPNDFKAEMKCKVCIDEFTKSLHDSEHIDVDKILDEALGEEQEEL